MNFYELSQLISEISDPGNMANPDKTRRREYRKIVKLSKLADLLLGQLNEDMEMMGGRRSSEPEFSPMGKGVKMSWDWPKFRTTFILSEQFDFSNNDYKWRVLLSATNGRSYLFDERLYVPFQKNVYSDLMRAVAQLVRKFEAKLPTMTG